MGMAFSVLTTSTVVAVGFLGMGIYSYCLYLAFLRSIAAVLMTALFPVVGVFYWIWDVWTTSGTLFHGLTWAFVALLILFAVGAWLAKSEAPEWC